MAIKKSTKKTSPKAVVPKKSSSPTPQTKSYKDLIIEALVELKSRKGISRIALKKYIKEHNPNLDSVTNFDLYINNAIRKGVESGDFEQPKGPSGTLKLIVKKTVVEKKVVTPKTTEKKVKKNSTAATTSTTGTSKKISKTTTSKKVTKPTTKAATKKVVKKTTTSATATTNSAPTYKDMIIKSVLSLNEGKGSSRVALKKHVRSEYFDKSKKETKNFDHLFNSAVRKAVDDGYLVQPKGPAGLIKILKKGKAYAGTA